MLKTQCSSEQALDAWKASWAHQTWILAVATNNLLPSRSSLEVRQQDKIIVMVSLLVLSQLPKADLLTFWFSRLVHF